jgi:hypothetical protein
MRVATPLIVAVTLLAGRTLAAPDSDRDDDGLSDFQETHKYLTDPNNPDTDADGIGDGDWDERREYTYTVRTILQYMPPFDAAVLNDDFQDARLLEKTDDHIEVEVIHYPFATAADSIDANPNWRTDYADMTEYLKPAPATNWDAKMRKDLLAALKGDGISIDKLTDKQVVDRVSSWLMRRSRYLDKVFTTFYVYFPQGKPAVWPGLEAAFRREFARDCNNYDWKIDQHLEHELLGKGMFYNKTHGSCTSVAIYLTTVLRALGIPTRMIMACPAVDASDERQVKMVQDRISHHRVRLTMLRSLDRSSSGFTNHTFNEVYVGNRWHRLNYTKLGQPILDEHLFGLHTHLYTFNDLSDVNMAPTWGRRYARGLTDSYFTHSNPYSAITISDLFGCHSSIPNPPFKRESDSAGGPPNIFILEPPGTDDSDFSVFLEVTGRVSDFVFHKTGRFHEEKYYDRIFEGIWTTKPNDIIVLAFSLDTADRVPPRYAGILPKPWADIEAALAKGQTVELTGKAHEFNVVLLAAPKRSQLKKLIAETKLFDEFKKAQP